MRRALAGAVFAALLLGGCGSSPLRGPSALVFVSVKDGDYAIFGADADAGHARRLTKEKGDPSTPAGLFFQLQPAWSPDGTKIAFTSARDGVMHIFVMNADGTDTRQLTDSDKGDEHPSWSADGKRIIFSREGALFAARSTGGKAHRVGRGFGSAGSPAYSPDGSLIAYDYRKRGSKNREIYVMNADGTEIRAVTELGGTSGLPAWSPDGKTLAFQSNARGPEYQIFTVSLRGTQVRQVTASTVDAIQPAFTPDRSIGFSRDGAIWVDDGKKATQLTSGKDIDTNPAWNPVQPGLAG